MGKAQIRGFNFSLLQKDSIWVLILCRSAHRCPPAAMVSTFRSSFLLLLLVSLFALLAFASESDHKVNSQCCSLSLISSARRWVFFLGDSMFFGVQILLKLIGIFEFFGLRFSVCKCIEALMCCIGIWVLG